MGGRVLIVEDNERSLRLARDVLEYHGYEVLGAATGEGAIAMAGAPTPPDLVLMDLQLPGLDGFETLRALRADPATAGIPVVALTAFAMASDARRCEAAGFDGYLTKPIDVASFPARVASFLPA